jgi:hypothetical protein
MVNDLRAVLRLAKGRKETPSAAIFDSRTELRLDGSFSPLGARLRTLVGNPGGSQLSGFRHHDGQELRSSYGLHPMKVHNTL